MIVALCDTVEDIEVRRETPPEPCAGLPPELDALLHRCDEVVEGVGELLRGPRSATALLRGPTVAVEGSAVVDQPDDAS